MSIESSIDIILLRSSPFILRLSRADIGGLEVFIIIYRYTSLMNIYDGGNDTEKGEFSLSSGLQFESQSFVDCEGK